MYERMILDKNGTIRCDKTIVSRRIGLTPEFVVPTGSKVKITTNLSYSVSEMEKGSLLSFYSVPSSVQMSKSWFHENGRSYFLSTIDKIDGHTAFWKGFETFGKMFDREYLKALDHRYSWSFFVYYRTAKKIDLVLLWDIVTQSFVFPTEWPSYLQDRWTNRKNTDRPFRPDKLELDYLGALTRLSNFGVNKCEWKVLTPAKPGVYSNIGPSIPFTVVTDGVLVNRPLMVTLYCGNKLFTCKLVTKEDQIIQTMASRSSDKFEALLIARFRNEDTTLFEEQQFTKQEITSFNLALVQAKNTFYKQIKEKAIGLYIKFPDVMYSRLGLGAIINNRLLNVSEKQTLAWSKLVTSRGSYKSVAVVEFYSHYVRVGL